MIWHTRCARSLGFLMAACAFAIGQVSAQHSDFEVYLLEGAVHASAPGQPGVRVFAAQLTAIDGFPGLVTTDDPGWNAPDTDEGLPPGGAKLPARVDVSFNAMANPWTGRNLAYWSGLGTVAFGVLPAGEVLRYSRSPTVFMALDGSPSRVPGFTLGRTNSAGYLHRHLAFELYGSAALDATSSDAPSPGVYLLSFEAMIAGSSPSEPIYLLLGNGVSYPALELGAQWVSQAIPEPSGATLLGVGLALTLILRAARRQGGGRSDSIAHPPRN